jgi:hypothetical protein
MDPIARALAAAERIERARHQQSRAREERQHAVIEARATMSAAQVAQALGISRARVYAIAAGRE